jgi:hypothetical protein
MPFVNTHGLKVIERLPGWKGRYFHSASMTFAHYEFAAGSAIHEHFHPEEEVYEANRWSEFLLFMLCCDRNGHADPVINSGSQTLLS